MASQEHSPHIISLAILRVQLDRAAVIFECLLRVIHPLISDSPIQIRLGIEGSNWIDNAKALMASMLITRIIQKRKTLLKPALSSQWLGLGFEKS